MQAINSFIFNVVCIIVIAGICQILIPEGRLGKYVTLVIGILIVTTMIKPIFNAKNIDFNNLVPDLTLTNSAQNPAKEYNNQIVESFIVRLSAEISSYIYGNYGCQSTVKITPLINSNENLEGIKEIDIKICDSAKAQDILEDISKRYGVSKKNIRIRGGN